MKKLIIVVVVVAVVAIIGCMLLKNAPQTLQLPVVQIKNPIVEPKEVPQEEEDVVPAPQTALAKSAPQKGVLIQTAVHLVFEDEKKGEKGQK